jgi:hypothetical protein
MLATANYQSSVLVSWFVPKSKGRKPKKKQQARPSRRAELAAWPPPGPGQYAPGRLEGSEDAVKGLLVSDCVAPHLMVELLPPLLWLTHMQGQEANHCVDGCMILHYAYEQLGIVAQPRAVDLVVSDQRTGKKTFYGRPDPFWEGTTFVGHCVLWLPRSGRIVDPTVEQYPQVRRYRLGPICGRLALASGSAADQAALDRGELPPGSHLGVQRKDLVLLYTTVDHRFNDIVVNAPMVRETAEQYRRAGLNLASQALTLWRLPEVIDRVRQAPYPRLHALLDAIGTAPVTGADGDFWFTLPGPAGAEVAVRVDDIALPAEALPPPTTPITDSRVPRMLTDPHELRAVLDDVATEARAVVVPDEAMGGGVLPVLVFEPLRAVGIRDSAGHTAEAQAEMIITNGFARFVPEMSQPVPHLPEWSLQRTTDGVELWDQGGIWARAPLQLAEDWLTAAAAHGVVQVIYGVHTGVRIPDGLSHANYTTEQRAEELLASRRSGIVATARIPWSATLAKSGTY